MSSTLTEKYGFLINDYRRYIELPLNLLSELNIAAHVTDYNWKFLFVNKNCEYQLGKSVEELVGKRAVEVFQDPRFNLIFEKVRDGIEKKVPVHAVVDAPLRAEQLLLKGYPLEDCYYFSFTVLPGTHEVINELREELKRRTNDL
jgi:hypothetical protein